MTNDKGWIRIDRKILDWRWYDDINTFRVFTHLLLTANWKDKPWKDIIVKRGTRVSSIAKISQETGVSPRGVRTCLERLKSTQEVTCHATSKYTVYEINNYNLYQGNDKPSDKQATSERQTNDKRTTTTKESNKVRKKERKKGEGVGEFKNVFLTEEQKQSLKSRLSAHALKDLVERLSCYIEQNGKKYKSHYAALLSWHRKDFPIEAEYFTANGSMDGFERELF